MTAYFSLLLGAYWSFVTAEVGKHQFCELSSCDNRNGPSGVGFCIFLNCSYWEHEKGRDISPCGNQNKMVSAVLNIKNLLLQPVIVSKQKYGVGSKIIFPG